MPRFIRLTTTSCRQILVDSNSITMIEDYRKTTDGYKMKASEIDNPNNYTLISMYGRTCVGVKETEEEIMRKIERRNDSYSRIERIPC